MVTDSPIQEQPEDDEENITYLRLAMRDQVDSDLTMFVYSAIDFIEGALKGGKHSKILIHCYKV